MVVALLISYPTEIMSIHVILEFSLENQWK